MDLILEHAMLQGPGSARIVGSCFNTNFPAGAVFPGMITGSPIRGPACSGELNCAYDRGRELWLRFTLQTGRRSRFWRAAMSPAL